MGGTAIDELDDELGEAGLGVTLESILGQPARMEMEKRPILVQKNLELTRWFYEQDGKTIELTEPFLRRRGVEVAPEFHPVPDIFADRQQLRQVLLNLFTNAGDAMPKGGRLTPRVRPGELPGPKQAVVIEVADNGVGIPPEYLARVTDTFFTTKEEGKGTGLGLAICRRIVQQHHGILEIESEVGKGTTVRVTLPLRNGTNINGLLGRSGE